MMIKNKIFVFLLILNSFGCSSQEIKRIDILFVDPEIETPFRIQCNKFEEFFKDDIDSISIKDDSLIKQFASELDRLEKADSTKFSLPDTRMKIKIIYQKESQELCIDRFVVSKNDDLFIYSESLKLLINKAISFK